MRLITTQDMADSAAARWYEKYANYCGGGGWFSEEMERIYGQLVAIIPDVTPEKVSEIIGHTCWTWLLCGTCDESVEAAIQYEGTHSQEYGACLMCVKCVGAMIRAAPDVLGGVRRGVGKTENDRDGPANYSRGRMSDRDGATETGPTINYEKFLKVIGEGGDWGTIRVSQIAALTRWTSSSGDQELGHGVTVFLVGGQKISLDGEDYFAIKRAIGWE